MEPESSKSGAESSDIIRQSTEKPHFMTVGEGSSEHAARLTSMINDDFHDSGYGGSILNGQAASPTWDSALSQDYYTSAPGVQASDVERHEIASHVHQLHYNQNRTVLGRAINQTVDSLSRLQEMNAKWPAHYPTVRDDSPHTSRSDPRPGLHHTHSTLEDDTRSAFKSISRPGAPKRAGTSLGEDTSRAESSSDAAKPNSSSAVPEPRLVTPQLAQQFSVLKIELKMQGASQTELVHSLERQSIASLLDGQIGNSIRHLFLLRDRIEDTSSKVLVTGDLNAGKSTFCNALLRRKVLPEDQQPCTAIFCEVLDVRENGGLEEVHAVPVGLVYDRNDESTYHVYPLKQLEQIVIDNERYTQCKIYIKDTRPVDQSLLNNGVVDIALIDAPGLNNDSIKTTAVFARQEEIDVVVFVVSAANHFTQSAKEFIFNAAREKAYMFMVVNGFDNIRDKKRCQEMILRQTQQLSPATFKESAELVHFVSSNAIPVAPAGGHQVGSSSGPSLGGSSGPPGPDPSGPDPDDEGDGGDARKDEADGRKDSGDPNTTNKGKGKGKEQDKIDAFTELETSLRRFVLDKRARSKLAPARTYLLNVLRDMHSLATVNLEVAQNELDRISDELKEIEPAFEKSRSARTTASDTLDSTIESTSDEVYNETRSNLTECIEHVGTKDLGLEYPGVLGVYDYAGMVKSAMIECISHAVRASEDKARDRTAQGCNAIKSLGLLHLGNDYNDLTFKADKMFRSRRDALSRQVDIDIELWDFFDTAGLWERQEKVASTSMAVTVAGLLGTRMIGGVGWLDGTLGVAKMVGPQNLRRILVPGILLAAALGIAYVVSSIPASLPRRLSAKLASQLSALDYTHSNALRISNEVRKALRYPAGRVERSLQDNLEKLATRRQERLRVREESEVARKYFGNLVRESGDIRSRVERVDLDGPGPGAHFSGHHL